MSAQLILSRLFQIIPIVAKMHEAGLPPDFLLAGVQLALRNDGALDLLHLWSEEADETERDECVADLQELIDDVRDLPTSPTKVAAIRFDELGPVASSVVAHKQRLRELVEKQGGVTAVARKIGMPQPSLSRFLNSASMPRKSTLYRLAKGLGLSDSDVATDWVL